MTHSKYISQHRYTDEIGTNRAADRAALSQEEHPV